ncbi:unnamed protein product [Echinostoma caproni]|uniref:Transmembrane protein n=1 Tax=Echinostoma caproni TaxID=27848 RepID=A0A183AL29_9TREM|nr:unnamed protein product [Echinostoma caproni]
MPTFLFKYAILRWFCIIPWLILLFVDELIRTTRGLPIYNTTNLRASGNPSTYVHNETTPSMGNAVATILWPLFASETANGSTTTTPPSNATAALPTPVGSDVEHWNDTGGDHTSGSGDSFVEDHAGVWVIGVMSGTCILTIAFIVRALFSRAEAFRDPQENMFAQDGMDDQMGIGFGATAGGPSGTDFGYL